MARRTAKSRAKSKLNSDINLTPLIDVMTCLLAIFMITAPMLTSGIPITLPKGDGKQIEGKDNTLDISIDEKGVIYIGENSVEKENLITKITAILQENPDLDMIISGDMNANYGAVIGVMAQLRLAGYTQVGLRTDSKIMQ